MPCVSFGLFFLAATAAATAAVTGASAAVGTADTFFAALFGFDDIEGRAA